MTPTFGLVTALPEEFAAMQTLIRNAASNAVVGDRGAYAIGTLPSADPARPHHVVLTLLGDTANSAAAEGVAQMLRSYPSINQVIMVGIAAGVPAPYDPDRHVRLGDVVVATWEVVTFHHIVALASEIKPRQEFPRPSSLLVRWAGTLQAGALKGHRPWEEPLDRIVEAHAAFARPAPHTDRLFDGDGPDALRLEHPGPDRAGYPKVHYGRIGSADVSMRSATTRDELAAKFALHAIEMEAMGVGTAAFISGREWLVVRGISDYADSHVDSTWRPYASAAAAAYVAALLAQCPPLAAHGGHSLGVAAPVPDHDHRGHPSREMADALARTVATQWNDDRSARLLRQSRRLSVSWQAAEASLMAENPPNLSGSGEDLRDILTLRAPAGRLVVLGGPGAGKTMLLIGLVEDLLAARVSGDRVPVLLSLTSWNPDAQGFRFWLTDQLIRGYPGLGTLAPSDMATATWAEVLLADNLILPVLDGLDEMRPPFRSRAIAEINQGLSPRDWLVLACRTNDYRDAVHPGCGYPVRLTDAAGITLSDVDADAAADYLCGDDHAAQRWAMVLAQLGTDTPVGRVLRTPLMLSLLRSGYSPGRDRDPGELCDNTCFPTEREICDQLFDELLINGYRRQRPQARRGCSEQQARRALAFLARHLGHQQTTEIAWWHLRLATPRPLVGAAIATVCGLGVALAASLAGPLTESIGGEPAKIIGIGTGLGILIGLTLGFALRRHRAGPPTQGLAAGLAGGLLGGIAAGVANVAGFGNAAWPSGGIGAGLAVGAAIGPVTGRVGGIIGGLFGGFVAGLSGGSIGLPQGLTGEISALVNGAGVGLAAGLTAAIIGRREPANRPRWSPAGAIGGAAVGIAIGLATTVVAGPAMGVVAAVVVGGAVGWVTGMTRTDEELSEPVSPAASQAHDRRAFVGYWTAGTACGGLIGLLVDGLDAIRVNDVAAQLTALVANGLAMGVAAAVVSGIVLACLHSAWGAFAITRLWLTARGHLPWRLMEFLVDAHDRGILRQLGPVYQFRHLELQHYLAQQR